MIIQLCTPIYTYSPINFRKIDMTTSNSGGFIRFRHPLIVQGVMVSCERMLNRFFAFDGTNSNEIARNLSKNLGENYKWKFISETNSWNF